MPFVAHLHGKRINALEMTSEQWHELRASDDYVFLVLPGCGVRATAKTSSLGRRFFAHYTTAGCDEPHLNETPQHRMMKEAIALLIDSCPGWTAYVEYPGPDREWVADVLAVSSHGRRIVFEIQLTPQSDSAFEQRSQVRFDAGAMPVWITPHQPPAFPRLPVISTGLRKSTPLPAAPDELLEESIADSAGRRITLRAHILLYLQPGSPWAYGDPRRQREQQAHAQRQSQQRKAARLEQIARKERALQQRAATFVRSAFNPQSIHPESRFPRNNRQALWTTGVRCHRCDQAYYVWSARDPDRFIPSYGSKSSRSEDRPEIKGAIVRWHTGLFNPFPLALLGRAKSDGYKVRVPTYFACPSCRIISDPYLHLIPSEAWLLLPGFTSAPPSTGDFEEMVARAQRRRAPGNQKPNVDP